MSRRLFTDVSWFEEIDSTNTWLLSEALAGRPEGAVAVADVQTAGRGRLDRRWESPARSGLLASVLLRPRLEPAELFLAATVVSLAARDACRDVAGVVLGAKWPNDLVADDLKVAGVLAETSGLGTGEPAVVVGIGINVSWPTGAMAQELGASCLDAWSTTPTDRHALLEAMLDSLARRRPALDDAGGRVALVDELAACTATLGREVSVELHDGQVRGTAAGIDATGRLLVDTRFGRRVIAVGDVVHLR